MNERRCPNCDALIVCGCQYVIASDGKKVCDECHTAYENKLNNDKLIEPWGPLTEEIEKKINNNNE